MNPIKIGSHRTPTVGDRAGLDLRFYRAPASIRIPVPYDLFFHLGLAGIGWLIACS